MDITPSPRILRMLGEIEFAEWQCVAELIDNSLDDFTEIQRSGAAWPGGFKVTVTLPSLAASLDGAEVVVQDTGRGMSRESLERAVRAGWSSNDRFDKLGLFGMGFNVSTARLGGRTEVLTTRVGDVEWTGVEIDFHSIGDDFQAQDVTSEKLDLNEHGTRITIADLKRNHAEWLRRNPEQLREVLGRVYSWILSTSSIELWVGGVQVKPRLHCVWGEDRYVNYGSGSSAEQIPAVIHIDQTFESADACSQCGNWQEPGYEHCKECGSAELAPRERRIHGWLGIQRFLDTRQFGIDFLRNGRKILQSDKRVFDWSNPNDPVASTITEYPVELAHQGGRIVGEIHLDHVPVTYSKNAFEYSDRGWRAAMDFLRGEGPLLPRNADRFGYAKNGSFVAKLIEGYRRTDAGRRSLIPGNGSAPIHEMTRDWARKFWAGDPDYLSDQKWWDAVESHEQRKAAGKLATSSETTLVDPDEAALIAILSFPTEPGTFPAQSGVEGQTNPKFAGAPPETSQERLDRLTLESESLPELSLTFGLPDLGAIDVTAYSVANSPLLDEDGNVTPVWLKVGSGKTARAFLDPKHELFSRFGIGLDEALLQELVPLMKIRSNTAYSHAEVAARLRVACMPDSAVDFTTVQNQAQEVFSEIRLRMAINTKSSPQRAVQYLTPDERTAVEAGLIAEGSQVTDSIWEDGTFILYVPPLFLVNLLESWPDAFMDGLLFRSPYTTLTSPPTQRLSLARVSGYLTDVGTLLTAQVKPSIAQLQRTKWSIGLLADELTDYAD